MKNPFKSLENSIKKGINKLGDEVRGGINQLGNEVKGGLQEAGGQIRNGVLVAGEEAKQGLYQTGNEVKDGITKDLPVLAEKAVKETTDAFVEELPALVTDIAHQIAVEASERSIRESLENAADVIEMMAPTKFTLIFGIELALVVQGEVTVQFSFPNPVAKLTEIRAWAANPPSGRGQIIQCIKDFGPESLSVELKISGNGLAAEWDGDDKYARIDAFLAKHGV